MNDRALGGLGSVALAFALLACSYNCALANGKPTYTDKMEVGNLLLFNGDTDRAIRAFEAASELNPKALEPHLSLLNLYAGKSDAASQKLAIVQCQEVISRKPNNKEVRFLLANLLRNSASAEADPEKAKVLLDQAQKEVEAAESYGANSALCHYVLSTILVQEGQPEKALAEVTEAIKEQPELADAHLIHAVLSFKKLNAEASNGASGEPVDLNSAAAKPAIAKILEELDLAISQKGKNAEARNTRAEIELTQGNAAQALQDYKLATKDDPNFLQAWMGIGRSDTQLAMKESDRDKQTQYIQDARAALEQAQKLKPDDKDILYLLAASLEGLGKYNEALVEFQRDLMVETDPTARAAITLHIQQLQQAGLVELTGGTNAGTAASGISIGAPGAHAGLFTSGALSIPFKDLIKIEDPDKKQK